MKTKMVFSMILFLSGVLFQNACKKDLVSLGEENKPPIANAGPDQTITLPNNTVLLDGSASTDPDNNISSYVWAIISGPSSFNFANANATQTAVTNLVQAGYQFELKVTDAGGLFSKDTVQIIVNNSAVNPPPDGLAGKEFIFNNLIWETADFFGLGMNDVYVGTPARQDLFATNRSMEVFIKLDTSSAWINVPFWTDGDGNAAAPLPPHNGYTHENYNNSLFVFALDPINRQIVGTSVTIKIKFL